jgi:hypothetical protein
MVAGRLEATLARASGAPAAKQLSIGALGGEGSAARSDSAIGLVELLAYLGDTLSTQQEKVTEEGHLKTSWDEDSLALRIHLDRQLRPALCLVADDWSVYFVVVGHDTEQASVSFGDSKAGERPETGSETITARYKRGAGETGNLAIDGLKLEKPFVVIVTGGPGTGAPRFCCTSQH